MPRSVATGSRTSGEAEVLAALVKARAYNGNKVPVSSLMRHFPPETSQTEVTSLLNGESGTYVSQSGGNYGLTAAGLTRARGLKPRGRIVVG